MAQRPRSPVAPPPEECYVHRDLLSTVLRAARFTGGASAGGSAGGHAAVRFRRAVLLRSEKDQDSETQQRDDSRAELGEKPAPNGASCVAVPGETWGGGPRGTRVAESAPGRDRGGIPRQVRAQTSTPLRTGARAPRSTPPHRGACAPLHARGRRRERLASELGAP